MIDLYLQVPPVEPLLHPVPGRLLVAVALRALVAHQLAREVAGGPRQEVGHLLAVPGIQKTLLRWSK